MAQNKNNKDDKQIQAEKMIEEKDPTPDREEKKEKVNDGNLFNTILNVCKSIIDSILNAISNKSEKIQDTSHNIKELEENVDKKNKQSPKKSPKDLDNENREKVKKAGKGLKEADLKRDNNSDRSILNSGPENTENNKNLTR